MRFSSCAKRDHRDCKPVLALFGIAAAVLANGPAVADHGDDHHWINSNGGVFETPNNWNPQSVPNEADRAIFDLPATYTVTFVKDRDNDRLRIHSGDVTFDIGENMYRLLGSDAVYIGLHDEDDGLLRVTSGLLRSGSGGGHARLGDSAGSVGTIHITGADATWHHTSTLSIGHNGVGTINVADGGTLQGSASSPVMFGWHPTGVGHITISGSGSTWWNGFSSNIGYIGAGSVLIEDGGVALLNSTWLARSSSDSEGHVLVTGEGSLFKTGGASHTRIARHGTATLIVENGAAAETPSTRVGELANGDGTVVVRDPGSTWTASVIFLGRQGSGFLSIENGGSVVSSRVEVGSHSSGATGAALVTGTGSFWNVGGSGLFLGGTTSSPGGTGSLTIGPGAAVSVNNTFKIWEGEGNTLTFVLAGPTACSGFGFLDVGGTIDLQGAKGSAGTLEIVLDDGYEPIDGHAFTLFFDFESIEGEFSEVVLPALSDGLEWNLEDLYTLGVISVGEAAPPCLGDITGSGSVGVADLLTLLSAWGENPGHPADITCSGSVGVADLLQLLSQWGECPD